MSELDFKTYQKEYLDEVHINAQIEGMTYDEYFFNDALAKLENMGEFSDPEILYVNKKGKNGKIMSFDAITFDGSDKSVILIGNDFKDSVEEKLTKTEIEKIFSRMLYFLEESYNGQLEKYFDSFDDVIRLGESLGYRLKIDYTDLKEDNSIDKIKLYIVSNRNLSERIKSLPNTFLFGKKVEYKIWNIERFYELYASGKEREPIVIDTKKYGVSGIPCLKAEMHGNLDYDAYMAIIPGTFLNNIYYDYGSRLLEGNVRSFLSARGKVNKGIRNTILKEPTKFFTYNNGIACTASKIILDEQERNIIQIEDLQIINGGQTTASITSASIKDHADLQNIFVPMKLTVVKNDDYDEMISNISKYSNKQNAVKDSDFFANHPFHRAFEKLSKKIPAPAKSGYITNTYWFYERARGKFDQEQIKFTTNAQKNTFLAKYPKRQLIKKEDLAKYFCAANLKLPYVVSQGAQHSMTVFAKFINDKLKPEYINEEFYKLLIGYAILFKETDTIVNHSDWYTSGGAKAGIVAYTISKLMSILPKGYTLDFNKIWKNQTLYLSLRHQIEQIAFITFNFIQDSHGVLVTEYCKKEETWEKYKKIEIELLQEFTEDLIKDELLREKIIGEAKTIKTAEKVSVEIEIYNLGAQYWRRLREEGIHRKILSPTEISLLDIPCKYDSPNIKLATEKQAKLIWKIRTKLENSGVIVS